MSTPDFLLKEYECCYEQLRFYDTRHSNTLKYLITLASSMATAMFAIYKLIGSVNITFYTFQALLSFIVFIGSILFYLMMLQNRIYYVLVAKQINSLRFYYCKNYPNFDNQLWVSTELTPFKIFSVHSFQMLGTVIISSIFAASTFYALYPLFENVPYIKGTIIFFIGMVAFLTFFGACFLVTQGKKKVNVTSK